MNDLKLWGRATSSNVQKVLWMLGEIGVGCQRIDAGGEFGVVGSDAFAKLNPNRKVPVLQDGDFVLYESHAILRYLARKHGRLLPLDPHAAAITDQWMDGSATTLTPPLILTREAMDQALDILDQAIGEAIKAELRRRRRRRNGER